VGQGDVDAKGGRALDACWTTIQALPLQPSFIVMTGGGFQFGYLLAEPLPPPPENKDWARAVNKELQRRTGGDAVSDISRVFRLPFTTNWPNESKRREGRLSTPAGLVVGRGGRRYTREEIEAAFGPIATTEFSNVVPLANYGSNNLVGGPPAGF